MNLTKPFRINVYLIGSVEVSDPQLDTILREFGTVNFQNDSDVKRTWSFLVGALDVSRFTIVFWVRRLVNIVVTVLPVFA